MAEKKFSLYNSEELIDQRLAVQIGTSYVALVAGTTTRVAGFEYYETDEPELEEALEDIRRQSRLLNHQYSETKVYFHLPESTLVPVGMFNSAVAAEWIDVTHGEVPTSRLNVENVNIPQGIVNVYRSNNEWPDVIGRYFRSVTKRHFHSRLIEYAIDNNEQLTAQFFTTSFTVVAVVNKQLQLVKSFDYTDPADALYHLLNVCRQLGMDPLETTIHLSGFIDTTSPALSLLKTYFKGVRLKIAGTGWLPPAECGKYPQHYFTSFFNLLA